jgi:exopolyphosphatase/guanosine-5'-triphosphate,3'-diphosphate pyrophosphatase
VEHAQIGTRLGEGLRERGSFAAAAVERNLDAVRTFAARARELGAPLACIATSAVRRADDADAFAARVNEIARVPLEVIDGRLEAEASYRGATYGASLGDDRVEVLDIGGGSTECAVGTGGTVRDACSLELGSVRIAERYPELLGATEGGPARDAARRARVDIAASVAPLRRFRPVGHVRCVAGTPLTVAAVASGTHVDRVSGTILTLEDLDVTIDRLLDATLEERRALPGMLAQRADILPAGALVLSESLRALGVSRGLLESNDLLLGYLLMRKETWTK